MSCTTTTTTTSTASWDVKYKDLKKKGSDQTGLMGDHQVHITVTNTTSAIRTIGWHISVYQLGADGHLLNDYTRDNAIARIWCYPQGEGRGKQNALWSEWGVQLLNQNRQVVANHLSVSNMKGFAAWEEEAWNFFFELFPKYMEPKTFVQKTGDFPALGRSTAPRRAVATSTTSSASSSSSSASASSSSSATKSASSK